MRFTSEDEACIALKEMDGQVNLGNFRLLFLHSSKKMLLPYLSLYVLCFFSVVGWSKNSGGLCTKRVIG